jgi:hypothetical protein
MSCRLLALALALAAWAFSPAAFAQSNFAPAGTSKLNIQFILRDNLGCDEVGACGAVTRGGPTPPPLINRVSRSYDVGMNR